MGSYSTRKPPEKLPREFLEIWKALERADREAPTRQALASRLGLSTGTVQRILVRGDVPRFRRRATTREKRSWARTLTRLAYHLGGDPRAWIEKVGIKWDEAIAAASLGTLAAARERQESGETPDVRSAARSREGNVPRPLEPGGYPEVRPAVDMRAGTMSASGATHGSWLHHPSSSPISAGLAAAGSLSGPLPTFGTSFLELWTRHLIAAVDPDRALRFRAEENPEPGPDLDLAVGVPHVVAGRRPGRGALAIPGWRVRLSAASLTAGYEDASLPRWVDATRVGATEVFLVLENTPAHRHLSGQCGIAPERIVARRSRGAETLARDLFLETKRWAPRRVLLAADEWMVERVTEAAWRLEESAGKYMLRELPDAPFACPSYPLGLAFVTGGEGGDDPGGGAAEALLRAARDEELFTNSWRETAILYGHALARTGLDAHRRLISPHRDPSDEGMARVVRGRASALDIPSEPRFARHACRQLLEVLEKELDEPAERAHALAVQLATMVTPETWHDELRAVMATPRAWHCHSCSVPLEMYGGVSDRYCRFCSDEKGVLRPREEVTRLLADWLRGWQGEIDPAEARRRAERFMSVMPAWAKN